MFGQKLRGKPKLPKAFCEICNNAIIAKYCELKRHNW